MDVMTPLVITVSPPDVMLLIGTMFPYVFGAYSVISNPQASATQIWPSLSAAGLNLLGILETRTGAAGPLFGPPSAIRYCYRYS